MSRSPQINVNDKLCSPCMLVNGKFSVLGKTTQVHRLLKRNYRIDNCTFKISYLNFLFLQDVILNNVLQKAYCHVFGGMTMDGVWIG
jgi:hypothetical protein